MTDNMTKNRADEPQNSPSVPPSFQNGTEHQDKTLEQLRAENDQMLANITSRLDECNNIIREINKGLTGLRVMACAMEGLSRAVDNFYAERSNNG